MTKKTIVMIVPRLPPSVDGLGDYGLFLAKQLRQQFALETIFLIGDPQWKGAATIEGFKIVQVTSRQKNSLVAALKAVAAETVLLNYVGYGYAKRGCPDWLVQGLSLWKKENSSAHLVTMFHELNANGPIWSSAFWTSGWQKKIAQDILCLSDASATSKQGYADILLSWNKVKSVKVLPVFSNVGEPLILNSIANRLPALTIFGGRQWRSLVYEHGMKHLEKICHALEIKEIHDVGVVLDCKLPTIAGIQIKSWGILPPEKISELLSQSRAGVFYYPNAYLSKSGIFAAYCAHKVLPLGLWEEEQAADGVVNNQEYWSLKNDEVLDLTRAQIIADQAYVWYQGHRLEVHASFFKQQLVDVYAY